LLWGSESILLSSIEYFLITNQDWKVINLSNEGGVNALISTITTIHPDYVIIHQEDLTGLTNLTMQLLQIIPE